MELKYWDRRRLLQGAVLALTASSLFEGCQTSSPGRSREDDRGHPLNFRPDWSDRLDSESKVKFQKAVAWLKANDKQKFPAHDPRSFLTWKKIASAHALSCQHMTWFFLPWHRLFLNYFEGACRYALKDASFVLPYWDWTREPHLPSEFFSADFPELNARRLLHTTGRMPEEFVGPAVIERILAIDDFYAFHSGPSPSTFISGNMMAGTLEGSCHNAVHNTIGGDMLRLAAPEDPIFWLHHANIDRLWSLWSLSHPGATVPIKHGSNQGSAQWLETELELTFLDPGAAGKSRVLPPIPMTDFNMEVKGHRKVKDLLSTRQSRYAYDGLQEMPQRMAGEGREDVNRRNERLIDGISRVESFVLLSNMTLNVELIDKLQALRDGGNHASLLALNVPTHPDPVISNRMILRFFVYNEERPTRRYVDALRRTEAIRREDYLGSYTFLVQGHLIHEQVSKGTINLNIDISGWLRQARPFKNLTVAAIAIDPAKKNALIDLFSDVETELKVQFSARA